MTSDAAQAGVDASPQPEGLSAFSARVLNQLSLSAWLPGAFSVAALALLVQVNLHGLSLDGAAETIKDNALALVVLALPTLVLATLLTQAFSFEAIRAIEGYGPMDGPIGALRRRGMRRHVRRAGELSEDLDAFQKANFPAARPKLVKRGVDGMVILVVECQIEGQKPPKDALPEHVAAAATLDWWTACQPWVGAEILRLSRAIDETPDIDRIMPTVLGNVLRSAEDGLQNAGADVEGFVLRHRHLVSARVLLLHDQFRTRLDMYATLVFVASAVAATAVVCAAWAMAAAVRRPGEASLSDVLIAGSGSLVVALGLVVVTFSSYRAAVASARGYASSLRAIDEAATRARGAVPTPVPAAS